MIYIIRNEFTNLTQIEAADEQKALLLFAKQFGLKYNQLIGNMMRVGTVKYYAEERKVPTEETKSN